MDDLNLNTIIGWFALMLGLFVAVLYVRMALTGQRTSLLAKLEPMQARFGRGPGLALHLVAYCVLPVIVGLVLLSQS